MRRTNRVPPTVLWSLLLGVALGRTATAQQPPASPLPPPVPLKDGQPAVRGNVMIVPINGTQRVQMSSKRPIEKVLNPKESVLRVQPVLGDPTSVLVTGLDSGVARLTLFGEGGVQETIDIVVQFDVEYLRTLLGRVVPTANVQPIPGSNGVVVLTGSVLHAEDVPVIMATAASVVGGSDRVINGMRVGGVMQVQLDTVVARVNRTAMREMGFNFILNYPGTVFQSLVGNIVSTTISPAGVVTITPVMPPTFGLTTQNFAGFLEALRTEGLAKLLTEPHLVTLSGQPARLHSGGEQPIPEAQGLGTVNVKLVPFGTDLTYLPIVLGNGKIHMDITTDVSQLDFTDTATLVAGGNPIPGRTSQSAHTVVEMEDGQTLAIGGLIQHISTASTIKVPVLGDVPYLGAAFSFKTYNDTEEELVILVTPHLVDPMACNQLPKLLPGQETRKPDDYELFLEGILEAPRGPRVPFPDRRFVPAYKNGPTAGLFPCPDGRCAPKPVLKAGQPNGDAPLNGNPLPVGNLEAKPVTPVAATPPAGQGEAPVSFPGPSPDANAEQNRPAAEFRPATLPDPVPPPANPDSKR
jgi:pilus assembly protein CpaC